MPAGISAGAGIAMAGAATAAGSAASSGKSGKGKGSTTSSQTPFTADSTTRGTNTLNSLMERFVGGDSTALGAAPLSRDMISPQTQQALNWQTAAAQPDSSEYRRLNAGLQQSYEFGRNNFNGTAYQNLVPWSQGNFNGSAYANLDPWSRGDFSNSPGYSGLLKTASGGFLPTAMPTFTGGGGDTTVTGGAGGDTLRATGTGNSYVDQIVTDAANRAQASTNSSFNSNGRFGGGQNMGLLQQNVVSAIAPTLNQNEQFERGNQLSAQQILGGVQGNASNTLGGVQGNAANTLGGVTNQAVNAAPSMYQASLMPAQALQGVGSYWDNYNLQQQNAPFNSVKNFFSVLGTPGGLPGQSSQPYFTNPLAGALGAGMLGSNLAKNSGLLGGSGGISDWFGGSSSGQNDPSLMPWGAGGNMPAYTDQSYY